MGLDFFQFCLLFLYRKRIFDTSKNKNQKNQKNQKIKKSKNQKIKKSKNQKIKKSKKSKKSKHRNIETSENQKFDYLINQSSLHFILVVFVFFMHCSISTKQEIELKSCDLTSCYLCHSFTDLQ